jgi:hypothetical protein
MPAGMLVRSVRTEQCKPDQIGNKLHRFCTHFDAGSRHVLPFGAGTFKLAIAGDARKMADFCGFQWWAVLGLNQ